MCREAESGWTRQNTDTHWTSYNLSRFYTSTQHFLALDSGHHPCGDLKKLLQMGCEIVCQPEFGFLIAAL